MKQKETKKKDSVTQKDYRKLEKLTGEHPLKELLPDAYVSYPARTRKNGRITYFNFHLAKEMGLIQKEHPLEMNDILEESLLKTFSLVIINEYDEEHKKKFKEEDIKPGTYMATRYLQPQHKDNLGLSSGDGRSIWNGYTEYKGKTWDVSSRGTGATRLSPATSKYGRFFESGDPTISYGCGYAELDEALEGAFFSEVLHRNHIKTERTLAIISFEKDLVIAVRAYENLLRPSHFFRYIKQNNLESLRKMALYYIERQESNGVWQNVPREEKERLDFFLRKQIEIFARTAATFEDDYIFCWMDWDGDNILMDGGIIDYGSVRQFGLYHHGYKFDDDGKFSVTIEQQKTKARYIAQTFIQVVDALQKNKKTTIKEFENHKLLKIFDDHFEECKNKNLIHKIGFEDHLLETLAHSSYLKNFRESFSFFERVQSKTGEYKVSDGVSHDAIFCMRDILRELPQLLLRNYEAISPEDFIEIIRSSYAKEKDLIITPTRKEQITLFQKNYMKLLEKASQLEKCSLQDMLLKITLRSAIINKYDRITGDSITIIADKIIKSRPKLNSTQIFQILERFISYQDLNPEKAEQKEKLNPKEEKLLFALFSIVRDYREGL